MRRSRRCMFSFFFDGLFSAVAWRSASLDSGCGGPLRLPGRAVRQRAGTAAGRLCSCVRRSTAAHRTVPCPSAGGRRRAAPHRTVTSSAAAVGARRAGTAAGLRAHSAGVRRGCGLVVRVRAQRAARGAAAGSAGSAACRAGLEPPRACVSVPRGAARDGGGPSSPQSPQRASART